MGRSTLLLDEPFGALDALTRKEMQSWLLGMWHEFNWTVMFVTHDVEEAIYLADRVIVLTARPGKIKAQIGVNLPRPRHQVMVAKPQFGKLVQVLLTELGVASV